MEQNNSEKPQETANNEPGTADNAAENPQTEGNINTSEKSDADKSVNKEEKSSENKKSESPEAQDAAHTAATAMSESMPMSNVSGKKIAKTFLRNYFVLIIGILFSLTMFAVYKFSANSGNLQSMSNLSKIYEKGITFFLDKNPEKAEEQRQRIIELYLIADKPDQDKWKRAWEEANNSENAATLIADLKGSLGDSSTYSSDSIQTLRQKADAGNTIRQFLVGTMYAEGKCVGKDSSKAKKYFEEAVSKGYVPAMNSLGEIYEEEKNYQEAIALYRKSAENGYRFAQHNLGRMYLQGRTEDYPFYKRLFGISREEYNNSKAYYWLQRSSQQGVPEAQHKLGVMYWLAYRDEQFQPENKIYSSVMLPDPAEAEKWLNKSALQGNADAMVSLADMYDYGDGIPQQKQVAYSFLQKAADKGNEVAQLAIAVKYHTGDWNGFSSIQKNDAEAVRRLNDLSKKGNKYSKDYLARMYLTGDGLPVDYSKAYTLFKDIVKKFYDYNYLYDIMSIYQMVQGNDDLGKETLSFTENALKNLKDDKENEINISKEILGTVLGMIGSIYENGIGVQQDYAKALEYYEESQKTGNAYSKSRIGVMTAMGMGKEADKEEAARKISDLVMTADMMAVELGSKGDAMRLLMTGKLYYDKAEKTGKSFISDIPGLNYFDSKNRYYRKAAKYFNKALKEERRDPISSFYLGFMSLKGKGVKKDFAKALDYFGRYGKDAIGFLFISSFHGFERAKEEISDPECDGACIMAKLSSENSFAIGFISFFSGMPDNPLLAASSPLEYIKKAAENGDENAKEFISKMENGLDTPNAWLEKLAEQGSSQAQLMLGDISTEKKETDLAKSWYMKSAEHNNAEALFKLGEMYMLGEIDGKPDYKKAMYYMSKSAEQGRFEALFSLAFMHGYGLGTSVNTKKYNEYVNKAWEEFPLYDMREKAKDKVSIAYIFAKSVYNILTLRVTMGSSDIKEGQGEKAADDYSGDKYFYGIKMKEDYHKANASALSTMHWLAYEKNNALAQTYLGEMYLNGIGGVPQNYQKAIELFEMASEKGICFAISRLAEMKYDGLGTQKDMAMAHKILKKGAEKEPPCSICQANLAILYAEKIYTPEDADKGAVYWYRKASENGDLSAQISLADMYMKGENVEKNVSKAYSLYLQAAEQENPVGEFFAGNAYFAGEGVKQSYKKALEWYEKAAKQDFPEAYFEIGNIYFNGFGVRQNYSKAAFQYRKAALHGHPQAQYMLGMMYQNGQGVLPNEDEAYKWYHFSAAQGSKESKEALSKMGKEKIDSLMDSSELTALAMSYYLEKDYEKAYNFMKQAAESGNADSQYILGEMYYRGQGVKQDYAEAAKWWQKSAEQGIAEAQVGIGYLYEKGQGVKQNYKEAVKWYEKAAEQGDNIGLSNLGECYYKGNGVDKDYKQAFELCTMSANQNGIGGQQCLGVLYENGWGVPQDYKKAFDYYSMSAKQDYDEAQYNLAQMYEKGNEAVKQDLAEARKWYSKAAAQGHKEAQAALERLGKR